VLLHNAIFNDLLNDVFLDQRLDTAELTYLVNIAILKFLKENIPVVNINGGWSMFMLF
jgi:hypothetical protein